MKKLSLILLLAASAAISARAEQPVGARRAPISQPPIVDHYYPARVRLVFFFFTFFHL